MKIKTKQFIAGTQDRFELDERLNQFLDEHKITIDTLIDIKYSTTTISVEPEVFVYSALIIYQTEN
ncbi:MAG: sporulation protein Cse60 [Calditrichaeota bacterium]|nr:sporulation protein Cse60 [Calditrichota bacterium]